MSQAELLSPALPSPSVSLHSGRPATTSLEVAKFFGKRHTDVLRDVNNFSANCPEEFSQRNFASAEYSDEQGKPRPMFILYRDGFMLLVMGYTGKKALGMKLAYIEAFNRMEAELAARQQTALSAALGPDAALPLSTTEDRKPLRALVGSWAKLANAPFDACWNQLKAAFQLANIKELPQAWLPDALAWVQEKIDALPAPLPSGDRPPLYRDGAFHLPSPNPRHIPGPREAALMALWKDWGHRARELERQFRELSREVDACRGDLFAHAVSDLGRHADTCFSTDSLLDGLYASQTVAEDQFKLAMTSLMCQLRLCLNVAVAMGR